MSWRIPLIVAAIALAVLATARPDTARITKVEDRPVEIATLPCNGIQSTSSGFVIDDELVVTVAHAIFESRDFAVRDSSGKWHDAYVRAMDLERDLAIVQVEGLRAAPIETGRADEGDVVYLVEGAASGSSTGRVDRPVRISTEVIGDLTRQTSRRGYELALETELGDSGAGLVTEDDTLVAIVFSRSKRDVPTTWATAMNEVDAIRGIDLTPQWDCEPRSSAELVLRPRDADNLALAAGGGGAITQSADNHHRGN